MNSWSRHLFYCYLAIWLFYPCTSIYALSHEKNSLKDITLKTKMPKIKVRTLSHQHSLFTSYLKAGDKSILLDKKNLDWDVQIPKKIGTKDTVLWGEKFLKKINRVAGKKLSSKTKIKKTIDTYFTKEYIQNIVKAEKIDRTKKEHYPLSTLNNEKEYTEKLSTHLHNSIEFKVLSQMEIENFSLKLTQDNIAEKNAYSTVSKKIKLPTNIAQHEAAGYTIKREHFTKQKAITSHSSLKEEQNPIMAPALLYPQIVPAVHKTGYALKVPSLKALIKGSCPYVHKIMSLQRISIPFENEVAIAIPNRWRPYKKHSLPTYAPKKAVVTKEKWCGKNHLLIKKSMEIVQDIPLLSIKQELQKELKVISNKPSEKHMFVEDRLHLSLPITPLGICNLKEIIPDKISLFTEASIETYCSKEAIPLLSLSLSDGIGRYQFFSNRMKKTSFIKKLIKNAPSAHIVDPTICLKAFAEISDDLNSVEFTINTPQIKPLKEHYHEAKTHPLSSKEIITITFNREKRKKATSNIYPAYDLTAKNKIIYKALTIGYLPKEPQKESDLFFANSLPNFLDTMQKERYETIFIVDKKDTYDSFSASGENSSTKYLQIANKKLNSREKLTCYKYPHPLNASLKWISFRDKIKEKKSVITAEKQLIDTKNTIAFPSPLFSIQNKTLPAIKEIYTKIGPKKLARIALEDHIPIGKAKLDKKISLPESLISTDKRAFFMHPMLSLFSTDLYEIATDAKGDAIATNRDIRQTGYSLFNWPSLDQLLTDSYPEGFSMETRLLSSDEDEIQHFSCTINTADKDILERLPTNILYILDTSPSIEPHRFNLFKKAIISSLEYLDKSATFNIAILQKGKVIKLRERGITPSKSARSYAKRFLNKITQGSKIYFDDIITVLEKEKNLAKNSIVHRSCILLSDGAFANSIRVESSALQKLNTIDAGNFSIYTASVSDKNNKPMLSLLAKLNHGFSLFTRTHASFPRKFAIMLRHIKGPLMHDLMVTFPDDNDTTAYINQGISPVLLANRNLTIFGSTPLKNRSRVFIQGRAGNRWINILKDLPLDTSRKGKYALRRKLAGQKTLFSLQSFLETNDEKHLSNAKKLAEEYDLHALIP